MFVIFWIYQPYLQSTTDGCRLNRLKRSPLIIKPGHSSDITNSDCTSNMTSGANSGTAIEKWVPFSLKSYRLAKVEDKTRFPTKVWKPWFPYFTRMWKFLLSQIPETEGGTADGEKQMKRPEIRKSICPPFRPGIKMFIFFFHPGNVSDVSPRQT